MSSSVDHRPPAPERAALRRHRPLTGILFWAAVTAIAVFVLAPLLVVAASAVTSTGYLTFPPQGFSLEWFGAAFRNSSFIDGLVTSVRLGLLATAICVVCGTLAAYAIARVPGRLTAWLEQVFLSPLLLPSAVLGLGLLQVLSLSGWRGYFLGGLLAHVIVASPFVVRAVLAGLRQMDPRIVEASQSLGAGPIRTFLTVVLPSIGPSIASGAVFAFVISFDEAVVTLFLVGPQFETLPVTIFTYVQYSNDPSVAAISTVIVIFCAVLVGIMNKLQGGKSER